MNRFLLGALAMGAVFVLTSFALSRTSPATGPAWTVSQYQLDRAFRVQLPGLVASPITMQMPATQGIIITEIKGLNGSSVLTVAVNGAGENISFGPTTLLTFNPPIIARPGDTLSITPVQGQAQLTISGYTTLPGET